MKYRFCTLTEKKIRVDMYVSALFNYFSRSYIQKIIDRGQLKVNGTIVNKNIKIKNRDEIEIEVILESLDVIPQDMNLDIIYEDENLLVINKDAGINVHPVPGEGGTKNTLVNGVLFHCQENSKPSPLPPLSLPLTKGEVSENLFSKKYELSIGGVVRPGIVHRLDKDTSGVIMVAKNDAMMNYLATTIKERKITKKYLAIVVGIVSDKHIKIESDIGRDPNDRKKMTVSHPLNPKYARSEATVVGYIDDKYTILEVDIFTGRTHQIRVHLASIGFPIVGDTTYGRARVNHQVKLDYGLRRQALHAKSLELELYGKMVKFEAELKDDMEHIIKSEL